MKTPSSSMPRRLSVWAAGLVLLLIVTGCGPGPDPEQASGLSPSTPAEPTTSASATPSANPSTPEDTRSSQAATTQAATPHGETFTNEAGTVSLTIPEGWTVEPVDSEDLDGPTPIGLDEAYRITDKDEDITVRFESHYGEKDSGGPKAELLGTLDMEELTGLHDFHEDSDVYFLNHHVGSSEFVELGHEAMSVIVADLPDSVEPGTQEGYERAWLQWLTRDPTGYVGGTWLQSHIPWPMVEALTGEEGVDAAQAFLSTPEYQELKQMMMSYTVHEDAIPESLPGL